jgi:hypothetical protein
MLKTIYYWIFKKITKKYLKIVVINNKTNFDQEKKKDMIKKFLQTVFKALSIKLKKRYH